MKGNKLLKVTSLLLILSVIAGVLVYSIHGLSQYALLESEEILVLNEYGQDYRGTNSTSNKAPSLSFTPRGGKVLPGSTIKITAKDSDGDGIQKIVYYWDEDRSNGNERTYNEVKSTQTIEITAPTSEGEHLLYVYAADVNGNVSKWVYEPFYVVTENVNVVDTTKPIIDLDASTIPESGSVLSLGEQITIKARDDESGIYYIGYKWLKAGETKSYTIVYHPAGQQITINAPTDGAQYSLKVYCANSTYDADLKGFIISDVYSFDYNVKDTIAPTIVSRRSPG